MYPPDSSIWWPRGVLPKVILTFWRMQVRMHWIHSEKFQIICTPSLQASGGQGEYYIRSSQHSGECNSECIGYTVTAKFQIRFTHGRHMAECRYTDLVSLSLSVCLSLSLHQRGPLIIEPKSMQLYYT